MHAHKHTIWWSLLVCFRLTAHSWTPFIKPTSAALLTTPAASTDDCSHLLSIHTPCPEYWGSFLHQIWTNPFLLWIPALNTNTQCIFCAFYNQSTWFYSIQTNLPSTCNKKAVIQNYMFVSISFSATSKWTHTLNLRTTNFWHRSGIKSWTHP